MGAVFFYKIHGGVADDLLLAGAWAFLADDAVNLGAMYRVRALDGTERQ